MPPLLRTMKNKVPARQHMTRSVRSLVCLGDKQSICKQNVHGQSPTFTHYLKSKAPKTSYSASKTPKKISRAKKIVSPAVRPTHVLPDDELVNLVRNEEVRETVQIRIIIRSLLNKVGEAFVTEFFERMTSPVPTADQIFKEELHAHWTENGKLDRLTVAPNGNLLVATPVPDCRIVKTREGRDTMWRTSYKSSTKELVFADVQ